MANAFIYRKGYPSEGGNRASAREQKGERASYIKGEKEIERKRELSN